jgi:hypothetical protein
MAAAADEQREELTAAIGAFDPSLATEGRALYEAAAGVLPWLRVRLLHLRRVRRTLPAWAWGAMLLAVGGTIGIGLQLWPLISSLIAGAGLLGLVGAVAAARAAIAETGSAISKAMETIRKVAEGQRRQVDTATQVVDQEVAALERQLQDLTAAGALAGLASDRATEGGYRRNLGLMTQIREDFQQMAILLARAEEDREARDSVLTDPLRAPFGEAHAGGGRADAAGDTLPRIDRIVLYIDDLDRCPPNRVVEVLEAVHLLLAVPLFVVVVAVDPRWLQQAVDVHYRAMLHPSTQSTSPQSEGSGAEVDPDDPELWASSAAQYLEKIFQIVFTLPPLAVRGYTRMLDELLSTRTRLVMLDDSAQPTDLASSDDGSVPSTGADTAIRWDHTVELPAASVHVRVDPYTLWEDERTLLGLLGPPLISTPRAVKRLTNSYGLLAAIERKTSLATGIPSSESAPASGEDAGLEGPAMVLLAALVGFPGLGPALFTYLHRAAAQDPQEGWTSFLSRLYPVRSSDGRWGNPAAPDMSAVEARSWRILLGALRDITGKAATAGVPLPEPLEDWAGWVVPVGRLSFPTGRIVSSLTTS